MVRGWALGVWYLVDSVIYTLVVAIMYNITGTNFLVVEFFIYLVASINFMLLGATMARGWVSGVGYQVDSIIFMLGVATMYTLAGTNFLMVELFIYSVASIICMLLGATMARGRVSGIGYLVDSIIFMLGVATMYTLAVADSMVVGLFIFSATGLAFGVGYLVDSIIYLLLGATMYTFTGVDSKMLGLFII